MKRKVAETPVVLGTTEPKEGLNCFLMRQHRCYELAPVRRCEKGVGGGGGVGTTEKQEHQGKKRPVHGSHLHQNSRIRESITIWGPILLTNYEFFIENVFLTAMSHIVDTQQIFFQLSCKGELL